MPGMFDKQFSNFNQEISNLPGGTIPYQSLLNSALNGLRSGLTRASEGFGGHNNLEGAAGLADALGSVLPALSVIMRAGGPATGTAYSIVSGLIIIGSSILSGFVQQPEAVKDQVRELLAEKDAEARRIELESAIDIFRVARAQLIAMDNGTHTWPELNAGIIHFTEGNGATFLHFTKSWLLENRDNPKWGDVLDLYLTIVGYRDQLMLLALPKLTPDGDSLKTAIATISEYRGLNREFAEDVLDDAMSWGTYYHVGDDRRLYVLPHGEEGWASTEDPWGVATDEVLVSGSGMLYGLNRERGTVWLGVTEKHEQSRAAKNVDMCTLPYACAGYEHPQTDRYRDLLFTLENSGRFTFGPVPEYWRTTTRTSHQQSEMLTGQLGWGSSPENDLGRRFVAVPGAGGTAMSREWPSVRVFFIDNVNPDNYALCEVEFLPAVRAKYPTTQQGWSPLGYRSDAPAQLVGITWSGRTLFVHSETKLYRADLSQPLATMNFLEIPLPSARGEKIAAIRGSNDWQLVAVLGETIWTYCPVKEEAKRWTKLERADHTATWAAKHGLAGVEVLVSHLTSKPNTA